MEALLKDIRYGFRMLMKQPGFTLTAIIALALGIGANTAIFSVVNAVLLRTLPYKAPDQLVMVWHTYRDINLPKAAVSAPSFVEYRDQNHVFETLTAMTGWSVNLTGRGEPERVRGGVVSASYFSTFGVEPALGHAFRPEEDQPGNNRVVVLSNGYWKRRFAADPDIIGQTLTLDGNSYTVIGVMPASFEALRETDLWSPIAFTPEQLSPDNRREYLGVLARLKPGVTLPQAQAEMNTIADRLRDQFYGPGWSITLTSLHEEMVGDIRPSLLILLGAVGFVLLIACANVANLLLTRAAARQKEIALRTALGATRMRVMRQLLTESVLLATVGGVTGLVLAFIGVKLLVAGVPTDLANSIPGWKAIGLDGRVLIFTFGIAVLTGIFFGLIPAIQASKPDLNETLKEGGRNPSAGFHWYSLRSLLVIFEVAIALVLLIGAGLLIRSFMRLQEVNPGFSPQNAVDMQLSLPPTKYKEPEKRAQFFQQLMEKVKTLPGIEAVGAVSNLPMSGNNSTASFTVEGLTRAEGEPSPHGAPRMITPSYFRAMGIPLIKGREFTDQDNDKSTMVAIVDEDTANQFWPGQDPIGKRVAFYFEGTDTELFWREIVGVVGNVKHYGLDGQAKMHIYMPNLQRPQANMDLVARTTTDPASMVSAIRNQILAVDSDQPVFGVKTLEQVVSDSVAPRRLSMILLAIFAAVAIILAGVGIYGVMSYAVTQRTHEIGIRMALGAQRRDVMRLVVGHGLGLALAGVALGLAGGFAITRVMSSLLFGVGATDPLTFALIPPALIVVALVACYIPARKAMKVDPMIALRYE